MLNKELVVLALPFRIIKASNVTFSDFREPANAAFEHEKKMTTSINNIYSSILTERLPHHAVFELVCQSQGEEEKNTEDIIKRYDLFGNDVKGLYLLDAELATRVYAPPTLVIYRKNHNKKLSCKRQFFY